MTRKEARDEIKNLLDYIRGEKELKPIKTREDAEAEERKGVEALEMAIKVLEQEPCEDCISRQAVLDLVVANHTELNGVNVVMYAPFYKDITQLPPVTPQQETIPFDFELFQAGLMNMPDGMTNGDVVKAMFPNVIAFSNFSYNMHLQDDNGHGLGFLKADWWDASYKNRK